MYRTARFCLLIQARLFLLTIVEAWLVHSQDSAWGWHTDAISCCWEIPHSNHAVIYKNKDTGLAMGGRRRKKKKKRKTCNKTLQKCKGINKTKQKKKNSGDEKRSQRTWMERRGKCRQSSVIFSPGRGKAETFSHEKRKRRSHWLEKQHESKASEESAEHVSAAGGKWKTGASSRQRASRRRATLLAARPQPKLGIIYGKPPFQSQRWGSHLKTARGARSQLPGQDLSLGPQLLGEEEKKKESIRYLAKVGKNCDQIDPNMFINLLVIQD